jgi:PAS domain S-box-containing protein
MHQAVYNQQQSPRETLMPRVAKRIHENSIHISVTPAKAGVQGFTTARIVWIPVFVGMTLVDIRRLLCFRSKLSPENIIDNFPISRQALTNKGSNETAFMNYRLFYLLLAFLVCVVLAVIVNVFYGIDIVYTHLFYIPIILSGIWYPRYAVALAAALGVVHVAADYATADLFRIETFLRTVLFIVVAYVISSMTLRRDRLLHSLRASEESFAAAFRLSPAPLIISSMDDGRFLDVNERGLAILGYTREEILGHPSTQLYVFADYEAKATLEEKLLAQRFLRDEPIQLRAKQGEIRETLWSADTIMYKEQTVVLSLFYDITERRQAEKERTRLISELQKALSDVKMLSGMIPICSSCKKIRDDKGFWNQIESYIESHSSAEFSHGMCPECTKKRYPDFYEKHYKNRHPDKDGDFPHEM